jgi:hypothetical protein
MLTSFCRSRSVTCVTSFSMVALATKCLPFHERFNGQLLSRTQSSKAGVARWFCFFARLRIRDAARLTRNRIQRDKLFLYTAKTATPVYDPLPSLVIEALNAIPECTYFYWTGLSTPKTAAGIWQESLKRFFCLGRNC